MTSPPAGNLRKPAYGSEHMLPTGSARIRYVLVGIGLCATAALSARLLWMIRSGVTLDIDDLVAYAAFLSACGAAPFALAMLWRRHLGLNRAPVRHVRPRWLSPLVASAVLSVGLASLALLIYTLARESVERSVQHRLEAIGALKASLAAAWIDDSSDDIRIWISSPEFFKLIEDWRSHGPADVQARVQLIARLHEHSRTSQYIEIGLRDPATGALLLTTGAEDDSPEVRRAVLAAVTTLHPVLDPTPWASRDSTGTPLDVGFLGTVQLPEGAGKFVIHIGIDTQHELYPMIELWPGNATAAEVLLLRREGSAMVVLNDTVSTEKGPVARRLEAQSSQSIGAALLAGRSGHLQGDDDRNQRVLAFAQPVEGTDWFLVAKLDRAEAFAELNRIVLVVALNGAGLLLIGAWWWLENRRLAGVERQHQRERTEQAERLADLSRRVVSLQEDERRLLASELHDRTGANLATININLKAIASSVVIHQPDDEALLRETRDLLTDTIASIREFCGELRPSALDYGGLAPAIEHHLKQFTRRTGIAAQMDCKGYSSRCAPPIESVLFRITQEAVLNCAKHSQASKVDVSLSATTTGVMLVIADNGVGFVPDQLGLAGQSTGSGLLNMRERAAFAGGTFAIETGPGRGTRITVEVG